MRSVITIGRRLLIILPMLSLVGFPQNASAIGPDLSLQGSGNLWNQTAPNEWVWNQAGDPWPIGFAASDPSGVCKLLLSVSGHTQIAPSSLPNDYSGPCPTQLTWTPTDGATIDTRKFLAGAGPMQLSIAATNVSHIASSETETVNVDNDPVGVTLNPVNDPNPVLWVDHAVNVVATPSVGPSGVALMNCGIDGLTAKPSPTKGLTLDGDGVHTVSCTAWNNAVDPHGLHNNGTTSLAIHIDEVPPSIKFEPQSARNPTELVADATDGESGVSGGSIELAAAGYNDWVTLPTSFDGKQLAAPLDDRQLKGAYTVKSTACDTAGNCSSATEAITLPLRTAPDFEVSLTKIVRPVHRRVIHKKVLVGWHWATIYRGGQLVRVKRGGHLVTVRLVETTGSCATRHLTAAPHRKQMQRWRCVIPHLHVTRTLRIRYGRSVTIYGMYTTAEGVPVPGQPVAIFAALDNHMDAFREVGTVTTASDGSWTMTLPPGPSRDIRAVTDGTATILPAIGQVTALVAADIRLLDVWPRHVRWGGTVHLVGQLMGGYLPPGGALVRLRIGYRSTYSTYGVEEHVAGDGRFATVATFGPGDPSISRTYWFQVASLPMGNYPFAPAASQRVSVIVGGHPG